MPFIRYFGVVTIECPISNVIDPKERSDYVEVEESAWTKVTQQEAQELVNQGALFSTKIGKRNTFLITISISIIGYALKWIGYNPTHPYLLLVAAPFIAFGLGSLFTLVSSMVADVCDFDELLTGTRREGMFGAVYWWMVKLGLAISSLISGILLNVTGFKISLGANQTPQALFYMRLCDIGIPIITSLIAIFLIITFDISEAKAYEIRLQVERRRGERRAEEERRLEEERRRGERRDQG